MKTFDYNQILALVATEMSDQREMRREHLRMVCNDCVNPAGHVFKTCCGETRCAHCPKVAWS
jgi:ribosomal protein S27E